jgi:cell division protein ZapA
MLLELNIADDYFKAKKQVEMVEEELAEKDKELYDLKHELIAAQIKLETAEETVKELQSEATGLREKLIRLEAGVGGQK